MIGKSVLEIADPLADRPVASGRLVVKVVLTTDTAGTYVSPLPVNHKHICPRLG